MIPTDVDVLQESTFDVDPPRRSLFQKIKDFTSDLSRRADPSNVFQGEAASYALDSLPLAERALLLQQSRMQQTDPVYRAAEVLRSAQDFGMGAAAGGAAALGTTALLPRTRMYNALTEGIAARNDQLLGKYLSGMADSDAASYAVKDIFGREMAAKGVAIPKAGNFFNQMGNEAANVSDIQRLVKGPGQAAYGNADLARQNIFSALSKTHADLRGRGAVDDIAKRLNFRLRGTPATTGLSVKNIVEIARTPGAAVDLIDSAVPKLVAALKPGSLVKPLPGTFGVVSPLLLAGLMSGGAIGGAALMKHRRRQEKAQRTKDDLQALENEIQSFDDAQVDAAVNNRLRGLVSREELRDKTLMLARLEKQLNAPRAYTDVMRGLPYDASLADIYRA
jgi:hypothetical protein